MSYEKTNWQTGDTITAEKLNHAEQGIYDNSISGGVLVIHEVDNALDKTWEEILNADFAVISSYREGTEQGFPFVEKSYSEVVHLYSHTDEYTVELSNDTVYVTDSPNGYPAISHS